MNAILVPAALLVLSSAALSNVALGGPLSLPDPFAVPGSLAGMTLQDGLNPIATDLGIDELATLREPPDAVSKVWILAPEPPTAFMVLSGALSFAALGLRRRFLAAEHRPFRKKARTLYRMMA